MIKIKVFLGYDHQGAKIKEQLISYLQENGVEVIIPDIANTETDDYPDFAQFVCENVVKNQALGILVCGTGIGMSIAANKINGIRCARVTNENDAFTAKNHNGANVIAFSVNIPFSEIEKIVDNFIMTKETDEERHLRRINKINQIEKEQKCIN